MKLIIDIKNDYYEMVKYYVEHGEKYKPFEIIANGKPYEERPHGEWKSTGETDEFYGQVYKCTHCGKEVLGCSCRNFCTWCGAAMR